MNRKRALFLSIIAAIMLVTGCSNKTESKEETLQALAKQKEVTQYTFTGDVDLDIGLSDSASGNNEVTGTLLSMFNKSKISWSGKTSEEPLHQEAIYKLTPGGSAISFDLPILIMDNIFYMSIPLLNKQGEYFSFDPTDTKSTGEVGEITPPDLSNMKNVNHAFSESLELLITDFDAKWFAKEKEAVTLVDGGQGQTITIQITDKNKAALTDKIKAQLPAVMEVWRSNGILQDKQAVVPDTFLHSLEITGGFLSFVVDDKGFIRKQTFNLDYTSESDNVAHHIHYNQFFDAINETPQFQQSVPEQVRPFTEILQLLQRIKEPQS